MYITNNSDNEVRTFMLIGRRSQKYNDFIGRSQMFQVVATTTEIMRILLFVKDLGRKTDVDEGCFSFKRTNTALSRILRF
jgi:hypothetical protein